MEKKVFDQILEQLNNGENPTPPAESNPPAEKKRAFILSDFAMAPKKRKKDSVDKNRVNMRGFGTHSTDKSIKDTFSVEKSN
ncbi:MAG: hypothetical protein K1W26_10685 [Acetatifactor sp.]